MRIDDPRDPRRVAHCLVLLLVVCGSIADCDGYEAVAAWGAAHVGFLRGYLPYYHGVPGARWLTLLMNWRNPALFSAAFMAWVREAWPDHPIFVAIDCKTSRRSHDRGQGKQALHPVSAFATASRLVLGQEAVEGKSNELTAIPALLAKLAENDGLKGAHVSIDALPPTPRSPRRSSTPAPIICWRSKPASRRSAPKPRPHSTTPARAPLRFASIMTKATAASSSGTVSVLHDVYWLNGDRRIPGEHRFPGAATLIRVRSRRGA